MGVEDGGGQVSRPCFIPLAVRLGHSHLSLWESGNRASSAIAGAYWGLCTCGGGTNPVGL